MTRDLAETLRRDDLWLDADARMQLLAFVGASRHEDVVLVELDDGSVVQALAVCSVDGSRIGFAPLAFGPVQEGAR